MSPSGKLREFRESTSQIPTPGVEVKRPRRYEPVILRVTVVVFMLTVTFSLAIALEVGLALSIASNGFQVPQRNVFQIGSKQILSPQLLTSFIPTILVAPLALIWQEADWLIKWYQPYVILSNGDAAAEDSLLLDYIALGNFFSLFRAMKHKHPIILISTMTALVSFIFQPLAGSVLQVQQIADTHDTIVNSNSTVGLSPDLLLLNAFLASAGFAEAAVFNGLPDPPFIRGEWAVAQFDLPQNAVVNGSLIVNTTGIQTSANCDNPHDYKLSTPGNGNFTIDAVSQDNCVGDVSFNPGTADQQYGIVSVPNCGVATDVSFAPVMFWYFHRNVDGTPEAQAVFCQPTIAVYFVAATVNLNNGSLADVTIIDDYTPPNNVTGSPLFGEAFNAVLFNTSDNAFVQARATAVKSGIPGAVFRFASQQSTGLESVFADPEGFLGLTRLVYTQHLSLTAKSIYFLADDAQISGKLTSQVPKLVVEPLPAHFLAFIMFAMSVTGLFVHVINRRARRKVYLTTPPGSIAAIVSLTSRSGFGDLLLPFDDEATITRKLAGLKFGLDKRTGAIVANDDGTMAIRSDDTMMTLIDRRNRRPSDTNDTAVESVERLENPYDTLQPARYIGP